MISLHSSLRMPEKESLEFSKDSWCFEECGPPRQWFGPRQRNHFTGCRMDFCTRQLALSATYSSFSEGHDKPLTT
jgi:hypothetical protein